MEAEYKAANLKLKPGFTRDDLLKKAAGALGVCRDDIACVRILREAVDARRKSDVHYVVTAAVAFRDDKAPAKLCPISEKPYVFPFRNLKSSKRPVVAGSGPAGIFCALALAEAGLSPILVEQGAAVEARERAVEHFFQTGQLDPNTNVQFGEGGAGTFSDGKLATGTRDPRQRFVLRRYVEAGAPQDILYLAKPHIGTDKLRIVTANLRKSLEAAGGMALFDTKLSGLILRGGTLCGVQLESCDGRREIETDHVVLAPGNGARGTFSMLLEAGVELEPKNFAVGVRIEQLQKNIDVAQYGTMADFKNLPAADYKVTYHAKTGRAVYSFCVCPGGEVVAAASDPGGVVSNGMSCYSRDGRNCNGALIVSITPADFPQDGPLGGILYQKKIEEAAYRAGGGRFAAPVQLVGDFLSGRVSTAFGHVKPTYRPNVHFSDLRKVFPEYIWESLAEALPEFGRRIHGFDAEDAILTAAETRTSSPVRIIRDERGMSSVRGLFPCGEGAGYAGGIMSAAVDGLKCAEKVCEDL